MLVKKAVHFLVLTTAMLVDIKIDAASTAAVKFCGRQLSEIMTRVCHAYNSPSWDVPTVVEQPGTAAARRRRHAGIADECCIIGCTWQQLSEYCSISAYSESPLGDMEAHIIADRSAEQEAKAAASPAAVGSAGYAGGAGGVRRRGFGRARPRGRRCWCRRKRRSGRRRPSLMGPRKKCSARCAPGGYRVTPVNLGQDPQY